MICNIESCRFKLDYIAGDLKFSTGKNKQHILIVRPSTFVIYSNKNGSYKLNAIIRREGPGYMYKGLLIRIQLYKNTDIIDMFNSKIISLNSSFHHYNSFTLFMLLYAFARLRKLIG